MQPPGASLTTSRVTGLGPNSRTAPPPPRKHAERSETPSKLCHPFLSSPDAAVPSPCRSARLTIELIEVVNGIRRFADEIRKRPDVAKLVNARERARVTLPIVEVLRITRSASAIDRIAKVGLEAVHWIRLLVRNE